VARRHARSREAAGAGRLNAKAPGLSLYGKLNERAAQGRPLRVGMIGAGKFGAMYLAQVPKTPGVHVVAIADLDPAAALSNLARVGWLPQRSSAPSIHGA